MNPIKILAFLLLMSFAACNSPEQTPPEDLTNAVLIPKPVSVTPGEGYFELTAETSLVTGDESKELKSLAAMLASRLKMTFKKDVTIAGPSASPPGNQIYLGIAEDKELGDEGYSLSIAPDSVRITANQAAGVFNGVQTLFQLLPDGFGVEGKGEESYQLAGGSIRDYPSYAFRSSMLDVSRHFFEVDDVKRYIDFLAFYKMNMLHLHLSDDQGWRIEIKSWPKLTTHGGSTEVGGGKGGYYTQEQYKDLVQYARDRYITIIPEIDMPGHTNAALASYPELNCNNSAPPLYTKTEVGFSTLCVKKDITYQFIDDVVRELSALTPGPYIHLGGDESHATKKADFIYFINKIKGIPAKYGKKMIGWEEIAQASIDSSILVQYWSNAAHAQDAVKKGAKIIMSPATKVYLDMKYDSTTKLGLQWAARIEVDSAYNWRISDRVPGISRENIVGIEAPLWTETLTEMDEIEYMLFPRLPGVAEVGWSPEAGRNWDEYRTRLARHGSRMKAMGIDFYESKFVPWPKQDSAISSR